MDWLKAALDIKTWEARYVLIPVLVSGCVLFLPDSALHLLRLNPLSDEGGVVVGLVFLASVGLYLVKVIPWSIECIGVWNHNRSNDHVRNAIDGFDHAEKSVLREFFIQGKRTIYLPIDEPTVASLHSRGLLVLVGSIGKKSRAGLLVSLRMIGELRDNLLIENLVPPEYIDHDWSDEDGLTDIGITWINENRPKFMSRISRRDGGTFELY